MLYKNWRGRYNHVFHRKDKQKSISLQCIHSVLTRVYKKLISINLYICFLFHSNYDRII